MSKVKTPHGESVVMLDASVTSGEVTDAYNVAAFQRKAIQLVGAGTAIIQLSLDGINWATAEGTDDDGGAPGRMTNGHIYQLPPAVKYVRATKSADASAVTLILFAEGYDSI